MSMKQKRSEDMGTISEQQASQAKRAKAYFQLFCISSSDDDDDVPKANGSDRSGTGLKNEDRSTKALAAGKVLPLNPSQIKTEVSQALSNSEYTLVPPTPSQRSIASTHSGICPASADQFCQSGTQGADTINDIHLSKGLKRDGLDAGESVQRMKRHRTSEEGWLSVSTGKLSESIAAADVGYDEVIPLGYTFVPLIVPPECRKSAIHYFVDDHNATGLNFKVFQKVWPLFDRGQLMPRDFNVTLTLETGEDTAPVQTSPSRTVSRVSTSGFTHRGITSPMALTGLEPLESQSSQPSSSSSIGDYGKDLFSFD